MKVLFTGGGTGGHVFPIIAVVREIRKLQFSVPEKEKLKLFYIGPKDPFGEIFLSQEEIKVKSVLAGKVRRYLTSPALLQNFIDIFFKVPVGIFQSLFYIFFLGPDLIFSKGGYGSIPVVFAGWIFGVPIFLHESDVAPGLANKILGRFSTLIFVSFPKTEYFSTSKTALVSNPIRRELLEGSEKEAKRIFRLKKEENRPLILILGGSQGAQRINDLVLNILPEFLKDFEVIHQCGEKNFKQVRVETDIIMKKNKEQQKYYHLYPFLREGEIKHAYRVCDLVVCRAGSASIFEISAFGKPSILIPLPEAAQNHQIQNATAYAQEGAAIIIEETNLTPHFFLSRLKSLFSRPEDLIKMQEGAIQFSKPEAAKRIAQNIIDYLLG